jgi:hypothetical protein
MLAADVGGAGVIIAVAVGMALFTAGLGWIGYLFHVGTLDANALAEKTAVPHPRSAVDWPELRLRSVLAQPDDGRFLLVSVSWPAWPDRTSILLLEVPRASDDLHRLSGWCASEASVTPLRGPEGSVELRKRHSLERVQVHVLAEA